jgi:putative polyhydroxyalkanoate system protein
MSNVHVVEPHMLSQDEAKNRLSSFEEMLKKYHLSIEWQGHQAKIKGPIGGSIAVKPLEVEVKIELGMVAKMLGIDSERLTNSIRKRLKENLA